MKTTQTKADPMVEWRTSVLTGDNAWVNFWLARALYHLRVMNRYQFMVLPATTAYWTAVHADLAYWAARRVWRAGLTAAQWETATGAYDA